MRVSSRTFARKHEGIIYVGESTLLKGKWEFNSEDNIKMDLRMKG